MAQKKLLFPLVIAYFASWPALCLSEERAEIEAYPEEHKAWLGDLNTASKQAAIDSILSKYYELMEMQTGQKIEGEELAFSGIPKLENSLNLKVFVSHSMGVAQLKKYAIQAKKYGATLVFNGLPNNSWKSLAELARQMAEEAGEEIAMQIDPESFETFKIKTVPAVVLVKEEGWLFSSNNKMSSNNRETILYDKVVGNIGIRAALRLFSEQGELAAEAQKILQSSGT
jgi:type-F conjugative transfer system pilin assembly protein TrbC